MCFRVLCRFVVYIKEKANDEGKRLMKLNFSPILALACVLGLWAVPAYAVYDVIVTPDQFNVHRHGAVNLSQDTAGAYPGDNANGYYYTDNFGALAFGDD